MRILTFDGGGIRGVLTAQLMTRIELARPGFLERTEFFAGTSIGSINAACFAKGIPPADVVELFKRFAVEVFKPRDFIDKWTHLDEFVRADFDNAPLKAGLEETLGDTKLGELANHIMIPAFDLEVECRVDSITMLGDLVREGETRRFSRDQVLEKTVKLWKPKYMDNFGEAADHPDHEISLVDACMRSSAAPTYFASYQGFVDGGMMDNNPSMSALAKAVRATGMIREHSLLSVGTGFNPYSVPGDALDWGLKDWLSGKKLLNMLFDGQISVPDFQVKQFLNGRYRRLDVVLPEIIDMSDADKVDELIDLANAVDLTKTLEWVDEHWMESSAA